MNLCFDGRPASFFCTPRRQIIRSRCLRLSRQYFSHSHSSQAFTGMNFTAGFFDPGSGDPLGFYVMILAMFVTSLGLVYSFNRSGWI